MVKVANRLPEVSRLNVEHHMVQSQKIVIRDATECRSVCGQTEVTLMPLKPALLMWACVQ